jgi:hypothetical protein
MSLMRYSIVRALGVLAAVAGLMAGCGGNNGEAAPPPTQVAAVAGDGRVTLSFSATPGVEYWLFFAPGTGITPTNWINFQGASVLRGVTSPVSVSGLLNDQIYSFTLNGRTNGGPGGDGSPAVSATPRLAGETWVAGTPLGSGELRSVAIGAPYLTVGTGGAVFSSTDGIAFTAATSGVTADLNDVAVSGASSVAVGANGTIISSTDGTTFSARTSGTTVNLRGVALGAGRWLAVGDNGTMLTSTDVVTWTAVTTGTTATLNTLALLNGRYVAVGAGGTIITSTDAATWTAAASGTTADLRAVIFINNQWMVLGQNGARVTSSDGVTWTAQASIGAIDVRDVTVGSQAVAVGTGGAIYTSTDGATWIARNSGTGANLNGISRTGFGYVAVGANGTNLTAQ